MQLLSPQDTPKFSSAAAETPISQTNKYFRRDDGAGTSGGGEKREGSGRILQPEPKVLRVGGMTRRGKHVYRVHRRSTWKPGATFRAGDSAVGRVGLGEDRGHRPDLSALTQTKMKPRHSQTPNIGPAPGKLLSSVYKLQRQLLNESAEAPTDEAKR